MEPKFQTSFIPKKPMAGLGSASPSPFVQKKQQHHGGSLFMSISVFLFVLSILAIGGAYGWKQYLMGSQERLKQDLSSREAQFNIELIEKLKRTNIRIDRARELLRTHLAVSTIFSIISQFTTENIRFSTLEIAGPKKAGDGIDISLSGRGTNLAAVAFQSDVLGSLEAYGLRRVVKNPIISNPSIENNSTVKFDFEASIDPSGITYDRTVTATPNEQGTGQ